MPRSKPKDPCPTRSSLAKGAVKSRSGPQAAADARLEGQAYAILETVQDPEIPVSIVALGLVYGVEVASGAIHVRMTLTAPNCPVAGDIVKEVERKLASLPGATAVKVEIVFDPPWDKTRMSEAARLTLGFEV